MVHTGPGFSGVSREPLVDRRAKRRATSGIRRMVRHRAGNSGRESWRLDVDRWIRRSGCIGDHFGVQETDRRHLLNWHPLRGASAELEVATFYAPPGAPETDRPIREPSVVADVSTDHNDLVLRSAALLAAFLVTSQVTGSRLGPFGTQSLTDAEVTQITRLSDRIGKPLRLILGFRSMQAGVATIDVYLEPDIVDAAVQRGRILRLVADDPPVVPKRSAWRLKETRSYACIALPGRRPFAITSDTDLGWPFEVDGQIDDATLISIVAFIRSKPPLPWARAGSLPSEVADAPVSAVVRRDGEILVALRTGEHMGSRVTLVRRERQWVITHYESWIV
jgi:hypothetical protein